MHIHFISCFWDGSLITETSLSSTQYQWFSPVAIYMNAFLNVYFMQISNERGKANVIIALCISSSLLCITQWHTSTLLLLINTGLHLLCQWLTLNNVHKIYRSGRQLCTQHWPTSLLYLSSYEMLPSTCKKRGPVKQGSVSDTTGATMRRKQTNTHPTTNLGRMQTKG